MHNFASQEHFAREDLQKLFNTCLGKQQELEEENSLNISKCNKVTQGSPFDQRIVSPFQTDTVSLFLLAAGKYMLTSEVMFAWIQTLLWCLQALSRLSEASNKEKKMGQEIVALKEQLSSLRKESSLRENELLEDKELFQEKLEDTQRNYRLSTEALNKQIVSLKSKLSNTENLHENERLNREKLEAELKAAQSKMAEAEKKVELSQTAHSEIQKTLSQEKEQQEQLIDSLKGYQTFIHSFIQRKRVFLSLNATMLFFNRETGHDAEEV